MRSNRALKLTHKIHCSILDLNDAQERGQKFFVRLGEIQ